jgi:hypothetical protein
MSMNSEAPGAARLPGVARARRGLPWIVAAVLGGGGVSGLVLSQVYAASGPGEVFVAVRALSLEGEAADSPAVTAASVPLPGAPRPERAPIPVPPDPFRPSRAASALVLEAAEPADPEAGGDSEGLDAPDAALTTAADPGAAVPVLPRPARGERRPGAESAPAAETLPAEALAVVGIIQGEPSLAVVRYGGQSHYLKVGDQIADTWRLREITERSAVFQLGAQRVEVPIKGGSSQ